MKNLKLRKQLFALMLASSVGLSVTGCGEELGSSNDSYDVLKTVNNESTDNVLSGVTQLIDVPGEEFKLKVIYSSDEKEWRITSDKTLNMEIYTEGLPTNKEVYIDNIHTDTSIVSTKAKIDGIKQDSMDDRIHNSLMYGFPISDTNSYYGINEIEGENKEFIEGYLWGYNSYAGAEISQERLLESDFLEYGVWANKIDSVIDLIIIDNNTNEMRTVSVPSIILVEASNKIRKSDGTIKEYDRDGHYKVLTR